MSEENEKDEKLSFDDFASNESAPKGSFFTDSDDFNPFADSGVFADTGSTNPENSDQEQDSSEAEGESTEFFPDSAGDFSFDSSESFADPSESSAAFDGESENMEFPMDSGQFPSEAEPSVVVPANEGKGKKKEKKVKEKPAKKPKKKKETGPTEPMGVGKLLSLVLVVLMTLALIAANVLIILYPPYASIGVSFTSTIYFLVFFNVVGLLMILVPLFFYLYSKDVDFFQAGLGASTILLGGGLLCMASAWYRYDFNSKAPPVSAYVRPAPVSAPAEAAPPAEAPAPVETPPVETPPAETPPAE